MTYIALGILLFILVSFISFVNESKEIQRKSVCDGPHKWEHNGITYVCKECDFVAGTWESENGTY